MHFEYSAEHYYSSLKKIGKIIYKQKKKNILNRQISHMVETSKSNDIEPVIGQMVENAGLV